MKKPGLLRATVYLYHPDQPQDMLSSVVELLATDADDFRAQVRQRYPNSAVTVECAVIGEPWRIQGLPR